MTRTSRAFDRAADSHDQTRLLPEPIASAGIQAILANLHTRRSALLLEVGAGTGRISLPLLERGANLVGCDLSLPMLRRQHEKSAAARLSQSDAAWLPFAARQFDGLLTIHVLHLVGGWRQALREFARVLRPGGVYVNSWNWQGRGDVDDRLRQYWRSRAAGPGADWRRPGVQSREELLAEVRAMGASVAELLVTRFYLEIAPIDVIGSIASRHYSETWDVPADVFDRSVSELRAWASQEYGDLSRPLPAERRFLLDVIRF
ncbi:MAG: class I SAM-dependent methyltransferase [Anaerolineales bacterium]|nr:class I SAM-dependent methyltransferase [Anaerolineales bacterium]